MEDQAFHGGQDPGRTSFLTHLADLCELEWWERLSKLGWVL